MSVSPSLEKLLHSSFQDLTNELITTTQALVQAPSENPPGNVAAVAAKAVSLIKRLIPECQTSTYETAPGIVNVVAVVKGRGAGKRLVFSGHLDTYPIGSASEWTVAPFSGELSHDKKRLYGRGSSDMKGGIAASIIAAAVLAKHKDHWPGEIVLALAGDEESMGTLGSEHLLQNVPSVSSCDAMICGDAGSPAVVRIGEKGLMWIEIKTRGKPAHGAHVHKGVNAIDRLLSALAHLKELENMRVEAPSEVTDVITAAKAVSEPLGGEGEADVLQRITVNIGHIQGGTSTNLVPDQACASADIRLPMGTSTAAVTHRLEELLAGVDGVELRVLRAYEPSWTPLESPIVRHTLAATRAIVDSRAVVNMRVGASDSRLFRPRQIPTVVLGLTPYNMGGPDEYVVVDELVHVAKVHAVAAANFLNDTS